MIQLNNRIIRRITRKLRKSCKAGEMCRMCGNYICPQDKAYEIVEWWNDRKEAR